MAKWSDIWQLPNITKAQRAAALKAAAFTPPSPGGSKKGGKNPAEAGRTYPSSQQHQTKRHKTDKASTAPEVEGEDLGLE